MIWTLLAVGGERVDGEVADVAELAQREVAHRDLAQAALAHVHVQLEDAGGFTSGFSFWTHQATVHIAADTA